MSGLRVRIIAAFLATLASVGLVLLASASSTRTGLALDEDALKVILELPAEVRSALDDFARPLVIVLLAPLVAYLVLRALVRGRVAAAVTGVVVPLLATWLTHLVNAGQVVEDAPWTFPSTHASLGAALVVSAVVVWPRRVAWWGFGLAAATMLALAVGNVADHAHYPRDVAGSLLVVTAVWCCCIAVLGRSAANLSGLHSGPHIIGLTTAHSGSGGQAFATDRHTAA
jgi:undecaprenyl-diphosphatase